MKKFFIFAVIFTMLFIGNMNVNAFSVFVNDNGRFLLNKNLTYSSRSFAPIKTETDTIQPTAPVYYALKSGYKKGETYTYMIFDDPKFDMVLVFLKAFTKDILYIYTSNTVGTITSYDIERIMENFNFEKDFSIRNAVDDGVSKSYIMKLTGKSPDANSRIIDKTHGFIYTFSGNLLESATYIDGLSDRARQAKGSPTFNRILENAKHKHQNHSDVIDEVNFQIDCLYQLPGDSYDLAMNGSFRYNFAEVYFVIFQNGSFKDFKLCIPDAKLIAKKNGMEIYEYREIKYYFKNTALVDVKLPERPEY